MVHATEDIVALADSKQVKKIVKKQIIIIFYYYSKQNELIVGCLGRRIFNSTWWQT